jgi:signal transduction histidine kinase
MSPRSRPAASAPRSRPLIVILLLTFALAGFLTYEAWDASLRHRADAERTMRDYAGFAAWEFNSSTKDQIYSSLVWILGPIGGQEWLAPGEPLAPPSAIASNVAEKLNCAGVVPSIFRVEIGSGRFVTHGPALDSAMTTWVRDTVRSDALAGRYTHDWFYSAISGSVEGRQRTIIFQLKWDAKGEPAAAYGFEICLQRFAEPYLQKVYHKGIMLPPSLTGAVPNDSLFSVEVFDGQGATLYRSPTQYASGHTNEHTLTHFGGIRTVVTFREGLDARLLIGGVPRSRLPLLLAALLLTLLLVGIGILQVRREEELQRLRTDFIASVSHELRTPLAQLRMFAETLLLGRVRSDDERERSLRIIDQEARRLSHLVENILQFSRAERSALQLNRTLLPLAPQVRDAVEVFAPIAAARAVTLRTELDEAARALVDPAAIRQILLNLLDNAVKYGPTAQTVRISVSGDAAGVRLMVEDEGPGIPAADRVRIWKAFQRLERDVNSAVAGSGIGLAVVCELVMGHEAKAWVEEGSGGRGARFVILFPAEGRGAIT